MSGPSALRSLRLSAISRRGFSASAAAFMLAAPRRAAAAGIEVDLQLVLAVDASGSVSQYRFELQKRGYAAAFRNPQVLKAILSLMTQSIGVTMLQWTGPRLQVHVVPWTLVKDEASAGAFAAAIEQVPRKLFGGGTSISGAIDYSRLVLAQSPFTASRRVIDVSGDGANNIGRPARFARDEAVRRRRHHQRPADPLRRARSRHLLFRKRHRRPRGDHGSGRELREFRRGHPQEADHRDRGQRRRCGRSRAAVNAAVVAH
jgi:hypothetical protein